MSSDDALGGRIATPATGTPHGVRPEVTLATVEYGRATGGEHDVTPSRLTLSLVRGTAQALEQVTDGRLWHGRSTRGAVNVMPAGMRRIFRHEGTCEFVRVELEAPRTLVVRPRIALHDGPLRLILESLIAEASDASSSRLFRDAVAQALVARMLALEGRPSATPAHGLPRAALRRVLDALQTRLAEDVSVEDLAQLADLSPSHFSVLFRNSVGEAPHRHLVRLRVERAQTLLESGVDSATVATTVGFCDQSHLARQMRKLLGTTPGAIARGRLVKDA